MGPIRWGPTVYSSLVRNIFSQTETDKKTDWTEGRKQLRLGKDHAMELATKPSSFFLRECIGKQTGVTVIRWEKSQVV